MPWFLQAALKTLCSFPAGTQYSKSGATEKGFECLKMPKNFLEMAWNSESSTSLSAKAGAKGRKPVASSMRSSGRPPTPGKSVRP